RRRVVHEPLQLAARPQPPHAPAWVGDAALPLVGEVQIAVVGEVQVVEALEALAECGFKQGFYFSRTGIQNHQTPPVVSNEDASIAMNLEAVRPAVVLRHKLPLCF